MNRKPGIALAFMAILILIAAQVYVVFEVYKLKNKEFIQNYQEIIIQAISLAREQAGINLLENVSAELEDFSSGLLFQMPGTQLQADTVKHDILLHVQTILTNKEEITSYLKRYLQEKKLDSDIQGFFRIHRFNLRDFVLEYPVFSDTLRMDPMYTQGKVHKNDIYLYTFREEHNYFEMEVSYYVDFSNRVRTIVTEMSSILAVLAFTVCIVLIVYILTLRTMVKQRKLSDLKSDFISNITHELKTPLSTIAVASSSLTLDEILTNKERSKELSAIINRQNRLLNQMIDQVLDISTLERSGFSVHKEPVEIVPFIEEVTKAYLLSQDTNSLVLKTEFRVNNGLMVDLDRFQMTRVLNNLLSNAVKYCTRKPEIRVRVFETNKILKIQVSDNGIGIPKEDQKEVFSKFFRCSQSLPKKVKGLGLGLYFVKRIVEAHQGMVTLESNPDKGSTFTIEIPVKTEEHENSTG